MATTGRRESHPISDEDLDKYKGQAEEILRKVKGTHDIEEVLRELSPEEKFRTLPDELMLVYALRNATCLYFYFFELLKERTGLAKEVDDARSRGAAVTPSIKAKVRFISAYSFFVMASSIVVRCEKKLRGLDTSKLAQLRTDAFDVVLGNGIQKDLGYAYAYYIDALTLPGDTGKLVQGSGDLLAVTRDYWKALANKASVAAKEAPADLLGFVANTTFRHGTFSITGLLTEDKQDQKVVTWAPVQPSEVIGDSDVTVDLLRFTDRISFYDVVLQKNPFNDVGGIPQSILFDGPPGTGKTTRMRMMMTRLAHRSEQNGVPYLFKTVTADQIKSEWYGKTAKLIADLIETVKDPAIMSILFLDDIDLIISGDRGMGSQGADNDITNALMSFLSGTGTNYTGNYLTVAATNKPTGTDEALRQRFVYRAALKGPREMKDFADIASQKLSGFAKTGLLRISDKGYKPLSRAMTGKSEQTSKQLKGDSWLDIGMFCEELNRKDPGFTPRSVENAIKVAVAHAIDFDTPEKWFTDTQEFRAKSFEERIKLIGDQCRPITAKDVLVALERQFDVEVRYRQEAFDKKVIEVAEDMKIRQEALAKAP